MGFIGPRGDWVETRQLQRNLQRIANGLPKKVMRPAVGAAMKPLKKSIRQQVNASQASTAVKREARKTIGYRYAKDKGGQPQAKAGFGVGKPTKRKKMKAHERNVYGQGGAGLARGVGLSAANVHWFVFGTKPRRLQNRAIIPPDEFGDFRTLLPGASTGAIPAYFRGAIVRAVSGATREVAQAMALRVRELLSKEARKRG